MKCKIHFFKVSPVVFVDVLSCVDLNPPLFGFCSNVTNKSVLAVQIFDQKKFKKKDQGFLGTINIQMGDVFDVNVGGDGRLDIPRM